MKIALIDTLHANLRSVDRALEAAATSLGSSAASGVTIQRTHDPETIRQSDKIVVPGQGGFGECLKGLVAKGVDQILLEQLRAGVPYLGICLGLQALFESSAESPKVSGLGLLGGACEELLPGPGIKIPHMGWNQLSLRNGGHTILDAAGGDGTWVYFVHSFHGVPRDPKMVKATVQHGPHEITAAIAHENLLATQFHPEKSQKAGIQLLEGFLRI